ncbi:hypothetical protein [Leptospira koniambonensis]|uniref:hypothetical protein n=1 Tax=Leptospira koniambonensis TaxID=2484950 RepID=UPI003EC09C11
MFLKKSIFFVCILFFAISCKKEEDPFTQFLIISYLTGCDVTSNLFWDLSNNYGPTDSNAFVQIDNSTLVCGSAEKGFAYVQAPATGTYTVFSTVRSYENKSGELTLDTYIPAGEEDGKTIYDQNVQVFDFFVGGGFGNAHRESRTDSVLLNKGDLLRFILRSDTPGTTCVGSDCNNGTPSFTASFAK